MLIEFTIGNYRSFKEPVTLSMVAAKLTAKYKELDEHNQFPLDKNHDLLTSAAIYGANASGKSNLIQGMAFMRRFVLDSSKNSQVTEPINVERFRLSSEMDDQPSYFEMVFFCAGKRYRYGFEADNQQIHAEWLYHVPNRRETNLFSREGQEFTLSGLFKEGKGLTERTRKNALFLSVVAQFNGPITEDLLQWFQELRIISGLKELSHFAYTISKLENSPSQDNILSFVKHLDLGIADIQIERRALTDATLPSGMPPELRHLLMTNLDGQMTITTQHRKYNPAREVIGLESFDLEHHESEGTKKIFSLAGHLMEVLQHGRVLIVDELDARLHPLMTATIIQIFNNQETNPNHAQLIFVTHNTNLLSNHLFRRDQIWFTEKDKFGATDLYSLAEYKVRNDASFESDYIAGKYGAIPFISGFHHLLEESDAKVT